MKFSEAILKGYTKTGARQCRGDFYKGPRNAPTAMCVSGAARFGFTGDPEGSYPGDAQLVQFYETWGIGAMTLNDEGMPWDHIYGMAVAAEHAN